MLQVQIPQMLMNELHKYSNNSALNEGNEKDLLFT